MNDDSIEIPEGAEGLEDVIDMTDLGSDATADDLRSSDPPPGWYHVEVDEVARGKPSAKGNVPINLKLRILAGKPDNPKLPVPVDRIINESIWLGEGETLVKRKNLWAVVLGLVKFKPGQRVSITWEKAIGSQLIVQTAPNTYEGQTRNKVTMWGIYTLNDEAVSGVPINVEHAKASGYKVKAKAKTTNPPKPARGGFDDLM